jgi:hypothetical protein
MTLYTVEYEERRFGLGADGPGQFWFPVTETFTERLDEPERRANERAERLCASDNHRLIKVFRWRWMESSLYKRDIA